MARSFNGSSAYLELPSAVVTAEPLTMACWFRPTTAATLYCLMGISNSGGATGEGFRMFANGATAGDPVTANRSDSGGSFASSTTAFSAGVWQHAAAVYAASNLRTAYLNGVAGAANTTAASAFTNTPDRTNAAARYSAGAIGAFFSGEQSDAAIWNVALTATEVAWLVQGARPDTIRPESLVFYNPMDDRWTYDRASGLYLSDVGPTGAAEDPPFLQKPRRKYFLFGDTAAPESVIFRNRTGSRARLIA